MGRTPQRTHSLLDYSRSSRRRSSDGAFTFRGTCRAVRTKQPSAANSRRTPLFTSARSDVQLVHSRWLPRDSQELDTSHQERATRNLPEATCTASPRYSHRVCLSHSFLIIGRGTHLVDLAQIQLGRPRHVRTTSTVTLPSSQVHLVVTRLLRLLWLSHFGFPSWIYEHSGMGTSERQSTSLPSLLHRYRWVENSRR